MDYRDIFLESTDSTNRVARKLGEQGGVHGSGVLADTQTGGRGRLGRAWFSPPGKNLYCSYIVRPQIAFEHYPRLTLAAGVAAVSCLRQAYGVEAGLKWPNDIYIGAKKCGGILCESFRDKDLSAFAVIGIGINCNLGREDFPEDLQSIATSLSIEGATEVDTIQLFQELRVELLDTLDTVSTRGFAEILDAWHRVDLFRGKTMTWIRADGATVTGLSLGPDTDGILQVRDQSGTIHKVISGDVNLAAGRQS